MQCSGGICNVLEEYAIGLGGICNSFSRWICSNKSLAIQ